MQSKFVFFIITDGDRETKPNGTCDRCRDDDFSRSTTVESPDRGCRSSTVGSFPLHVIDLVRGAFVEMVNRREGPRRRQNVVVRIVASRRLIAALHRRVLVRGRLLALLHEENDDDRQKDERDADEAAAQTVQDEPFRIG